MIVSVDLGNKNVKTPELVFLSGLEAYDTNPMTIFGGNDCIFYNGKYYTLGDHRIAYTREKYKDERFFILTLMAIAKEIKRRGLKGDNYEIELLLSLPPAHYATQHKKLEEYMKVKGEHVNFLFNDQPMSVIFKSVTVFIQGHAALYTRPQLIKEHPLIMLHDIGGFTWDYLSVRKGKPESTIMDTLEHGIIPFYNKLNSYTTSEYNLHLMEDDIDDLIKDRTLPPNMADIQARVLNTLDTTAMQYLKEGFVAFAENKIDLKMYTNIFVGGAATIFKPYILQLQKENMLGQAEFIEDVHANASGAQILYKNIKKRMATKQQ